MRARFINEIKRAESVTKGLGIGVGNMFKGYYMLERNFPDLIDNPDLNRPVYEVIESFETSAKYDIMKRQLVEMKFMIGHFVHENLDDVAFLNTMKYVGDSLTRTENAVDDEKLDTILDEIFDDAVELADEDITSPDGSRIILSWKITWNKSMQAGQLFIHDLVRKEHVQGVIARFR
jgi:hypothetical protein